MHRNAIVFGARSALGNAIVSRLDAQNVDVTVARSWDQPPTIHEFARDSVAELTDETLVEALVGKNWVFVCGLPALDNDHRAFAARSVPAFRNLVTAGREAGIDRIILTLPASVAWVPGKSKLTLADRYLFGTAADPWVDAFYTLVQEATYAAADGVDCIVIASALVVGDGVAPLRVGLPRDSRSVDVVHLDEAARMHVQAAEALSWGETALLGGHSVTRRDLAELIPAPRRRGLLGSGGDDPRRHLIDPGVSIDPAAAVEQLGFNPHAGF